MSKNVLVFFFLFAFLEKLRSKCRNIIYYGKQYRKESYKNHNSKGRLQKLFYISQNIIIIRRFMCNIFFPY